MSGNHISERLTSKLRAAGLLPKDQPVQLKRTFSSGSSRRAGKWVWTAVNPVTKEPYQLGSRFTMEALLASPELATCETAAGLAVNAAGSAPRYEVSPGAPSTDRTHPDDLAGLRLALSEAQFASKDPETPVQVVIKHTADGPRVIREYRDGACLTTHERAL